MTRAFWISLMLLVLSPTFVSANEFVVLTGVDDVNPNLPASVQATLDEAVMDYYLEPSVAKVDTVLDIMNESDLLRKKTAWAPIIGFLSVVFQNNKDHVMAWMSRNDYNTYAEDVFVSALLHAKLKSQALVFARAHQWKKIELDRLAAADDRVDLKHLLIVLPGHIDTLWGAFFASGDTQYLNEIMNVLTMKQVPSSEQIVPPTQYDVLSENKTLAKTTLKRYAAQHRTVKDAIKARLKVEKDPEMRSQLRQLLPCETCTKLPLNSPADIQ